MRLGVPLITLFLLSFLFSLPVQATEFSSSNFILREPRFDDGRFGTSTSFQYMSITNEIGIDLNAGSVSFAYENDPLMLPIPRQPVVSASGVSGGVSLSWVDTTGLSGSITGFDVGYSVTSGGPYTFISLGSVSSYTISSLTAGTQYYMIVRAKAGSVVLSESVQVSATPLAASSGGGGGGGGSGGVFTIDDLRRIVLPKPLKPASPIAILLIDFNKDGYINVADLSILLFYFERRDEAIQPYDLSRDGVVDLVDVSILLYYWTDNEPYTSIPYIVL